MLVHRPANNRAASFPEERQHDNQETENDQSETEEAETEEAESEEVEDDQSQSQEEADSADDTRQRYKFVSDADFVSAKSNRSHRQDPSVKCRPCFRDRRYCDNAKPKCSVCVEKKSVCVPQGTINY